MEWKPYLKDRLVAEHPDGFFIIKTQDTQDGQPIFCPVCDFIMMSIFDDESYEKYKCCEACSNRWVYQNMKRWMDGWRPTKEEIIEKIS